MAFSDSVVQAAWQRAGGCCECTRSTHGHAGRCNARLVWAARGVERGIGGWEAHHKTSVAAGGADVENNCEILCQPCHKKTQTYGG